MFQTGVCESPAEFSHPPMVTTRAHLRRCTARRAHISWAAAALGMDGSGLERRGYRRTQQQLSGSSKLVTVSGIHVTYAIFC